MNAEKLKEEQLTRELFDQQYLEADDREEIDFWEPLAKIIMESIELRDAKNMTQADLAKKMRTRQSVISRFENMGRLPSYKFFTKLSMALGHTPGMTLYGDYMAVVPLEKQAWVKERADKERMPTKRFVQNLLDGSLVSSDAIKQEDATTKYDSPAKPNRLSWLDSADEKGVLSESKAPGKEESLYSSTPPQPQQAAA